MKIPLEKPAVNISKLTVGKNKKVRRGAMHEKWFILFTGNNEWKSE